MHHIHRRLSPSLIVAIVALFVALAGTAAAAVIITSPDQLGNNVVTDRSIASNAVSSSEVFPESLNDTDLSDPQLKLRVKGDGTKNGTGDGSVKRTPNTTKGVYDVTFDASALNARGLTNSDSVVTENCAITATARSAANPPQISIDSFPVVFNLRTVGPNTVRVSTLSPDVPPGRLVDTAFDIVASC